MKKIFKLIITGILLSMIVACGKAEDNNPTTTSTAPSTTSSIGETTTIEEETTPQRGIIPNTAGIVVIKEENKTEEEPTTEVINKREASYSAEEDAKRLGVSKIVVFQSDYSMVYNVGTDIMSEFNTLLVEKYTCDFVVSFVGIDMFENYYNTLADLKNREQQVDITMAAIDADYDKLIGEGFLLDITEYLTKTDEGIKLYNAYAKEMWESVRREGRIYGYDNDVITARTNVLSCNKDLATSLGLDAKEGFSFYDIGEILANKDISKLSKEGVVPLYADEEYLYRMLGYYDVGCGIFAKKDETGKWVAFNGVEDEGFNKLFKTLREYNEKGWLKIGTSNGIKAKKGLFLFSAFSFEYSSAYPFGETMDKLRTSTTQVDVIPGTIYHGFRDLMEDEIYCVTTWATYKEEALRLITLLSTEEELANLLRHGIENKYYIYRDRIVRKLPTVDNDVMGSRAPVNLALTYPQYIEPDAKQEFYKTQFSKCEAGPFLEYEILHDRLEELKESHDPDNILGQIYEQGFARLMAGGYEDVDGTVAEIRRIQKEAGIDEYIAAINAEFESQRKK